MDRTVQQAGKLLVFVFAELVVYAVRPLKLAEGEKERHQRVAEDHAEDSLFLVAPVGDEYLLLHDTEASPLREPPDQLYVVELQAWVESSTTPEEVASHGDADPCSRGHDSLKRFRDEVEERVEALHRRCGMVGHVEWASNVEVPTLELFQETLEEGARKSDVGVEKIRTSPVALLPPRFLPHATGAGGVCVNSCTDGKRRTSATVPSVEPPSTTSTSSGFLVWLAMSESRAPTWRSSFSVGMMTLSLLTPSRLLLTLRL